MPVFLYTDILLFLLIGIVIAYLLYARKHEHLSAPWKRLAKDSVAMASAAVLLVYLLVAVLDSIHYRPAIVNENTTAEKQYSAEVLSVFDTLVTTMRTQDEKTYSAPFASHLYAKETIELADGSTIRAYPELKYGAAHLSEGESKITDIVYRSLLGILVGLLAGLLLSIALAIRAAHKYKQTIVNAFVELWSNKTETRWRAFVLCLTMIFMLIGVIWQLAPYYHILGTDKVGKDVLYQALKSIRTGLLIGTLTTLVMLPFAIAMGIAAGYFRGWIDDVIQYIYTTLNSIPGVLLIAAAVLMLQVYMDNNAEQYTSLLERADMRLLFLCMILGVTSWTGLCRYLRAESLKLREMDYIAAARGLGVGHGTIIFRHILPNVMHIVLITVVLDFSGLVLAEAVLAYVQIGVDPTTESWGNMINSARLEMAREPIVWWSLTAAFIFMFVLVLAANLFADAVRDALDPKESSTHGEQGHG